MAHYANKKNIYIQLFCTNSTSGFFYACVEEPCSENYRKYFIYYIIFCILFDIVGHRLCVVGNCDVL